MRTWRGLFAITAGALLAVTACGSDGDGSSDPGDAGETNESSEQSGGTFSVATDEPDHLTGNRTTGAFNEVSALYAPLVKFTDSGEPHYVQAESIESDDNIVWTITIKDGWTWHNGEPVTAQNYADAWNATAYGPNAWANNGQFVNIEGYDALNPAEGDPTAETLSGVEVVDETTLRVTLKGPDSQFPYKLSQVGFLALPEVAFEDLDAYDEAPVGNGAFQMDGSWQHDVEIRMTRYEDYQGEPANADAMVFKIYSDADTAYTDAVGGQVDIVAVPQSKLRQVEQDFGDRFIAFESVRLDWLGFPLWEEQFADKKVRQAISMAIDRDAVNDAIFAGVYTPATSFHGSNAIGGGTVGLCGEFCEFDPEKANQLLEESNWEGSTIELWYPGGVGYDQTFEAYANQIRQNLDMIEEVKLETQPGFSPYLEALSGEQVTGMFRAGWGSIYPSMQSQLGSVWATTGEYHYSAGGYDNPEVDQLVQEADAAPTAEEAAQLYQEAEALIFEDFPAVPLFYATYNFAHGENVSNVIIGFNEIELAEVVVENQ